MKRIVASWLAGLGVVALVALAGYVMAEPAGVPRNRQQSIPQTAVSQVNNQAITPASVVTPFIDAGCSIVGGVTLCNNNATGAGTAKFQTYDGGSGYIVANWEVGGNVIAHTALVSDIGTGNAAVQIGNGTVCFNGVCSGANMLGAGAGFLVRSNLTTILSSNTGSGDLVVPVGFINNTDTGTTGGYRLNSKMMAVAAAPTISSGFGTNPSIATNNGTIGFTIDVGTGGTASSGVVGLTACNSKWICRCSQLDPTLLTEVRMSATTTTTCTLTNTTIATGVAAAFPASAILYCDAHPI